MFLIWMVPLMPFASQLFDFSSPSFVHDRDLDFNEKLRSSFWAMQQCLETVGLF